MLACFLAAVLGLLALGDAKALSAAVGVEVATLEDARTPAYIGLFLAIAFLAEIALSLMADGSEQPRRQ